MTQIVTGFRSEPSRRTDASSSSSAPAILSSSSLVHVLICISFCDPRGGFAFARRLRSKLDHDLECLAFVHCAVALGHLVDAHDPVEDATRLDPAFQAVRQELP